VERYEAYTYGKAKQDEFVIDFGEKHKIPYVIVRPGAVYVPGKNSLSARVGIGTFGIFLHLGGGNRIPFSYVDNCAEAMVLAGIKKGVEGEVFNIVDDDLPKSRKFLKMYKKNVKKFKSISMPYRLFYIFSFVWEKYSKWSKGQIPPVFNRNRCSAYWKGNRYSNKKMKELLGWKQKVPTKEGMRLFFEYNKKKGELIK
jgi:nucleoside-diphosphate-sugar epimerase